MSTLVCLCLPVPRYKCLSVHTTLPHPRYLVHVGLACLHDSPAPGWQSYNLVCRPAALASPIHLCYRSRFPQSRSGRLIRRRVYLPTATQQVLGVDSNSIVGVILSPHRHVVCPRSASLQSQQYEWWFRSIRHHVPGATGHDNWLPLGDADSTPDGRPGRTTTDAKKRHSQTSTSTPQSSVT